MAIILPRVHLNQHSTQWHEVEQRLFAPATQAEKNAQLELGIAAAIAGHWPKAEPHLNRLIAEGADINAALGPLSEPARGGWWGFKTLCMNAWNWCLDQGFNIDDPLPGVDLTFLQMTFADQWGTNGDDVTKRYRDALWRHCPDVRVRNRAGRTALHEAALSGNADWIGRLVDSGALVNVACSRGTTPLSEAASSGSLKTVQALLDRGAAWGAPDTICPLAAATYAFVVAERRSYNVIEALLALGMDPQAKPGGARSAVEILQEGLQRSPAAAHRLAPLKSLIESSCIAQNLPAPQAPRPRL